MRLVVAAAILTALTACTPPPLTEPGDAGGGQPDAGEEGVPFTDVAGILREDCNGGDCHGESGRAGLEFPDGPDSSDEQIREALDGTTVEGEDAPFIVPGQPQESALYESLKALNGRQQMPLSGRLRDEKIETIRLWIEQGASYE